MFSVTLWFVPVRGIRGLYFFWNIACIMAMRVGTTEDTLKHKLRWDWGLMLPGVEGDGGAMVAKGGGLF